MSQVPAKYLKDENSNIITPITSYKSTIITKGLTLYDYIKHQEEIPIMTVPLYFNQSGLSVNHNNWVELGGNYYFAYSMPNQANIPVLPGFKRYVRMKAILTDNVNVADTRGIVVAGWRNDGSYDNTEFSFSNTWGSPTRDRRCVLSINEVAYDNIYKGHLILKAIIAGEAANDATGTLYYLELQFIDRLAV